VPAQLPKSQKLLFADLTLKGLGLLYFLHGPAGLFWLGIRPDGLERRPRAQVQADDVPLEIIIVVENSVALYAFLAVLSQVIDRLRIFLAELIEFLDVKPPIVLIVAFP